MESPTYGLSINIYVRGDANLGDGPSHMGIAIYQHGSSTCEMHHIRNPTDEDFVYDPRMQPLEDPVLKGRCEIASLSSEQKQRAVSLLSAFGNDSLIFLSSGLGIARAGLLVLLGYLSVLVLFLLTRGCSGRV